MLLPITIDATECLLLTAEPDRAGALQTTCKHLTQREVGLSNREHRRAYSAALRWTLKFSARLNLAEGRALRAALRGSDNEPILCPMWPAAGLVADAATAPLVGGLKVTWEPDWSAYELHTGAAVGTYSTAAMTAPVLWARWDKPPEPVAESDERGDVAFSLVENGPAEYSIGPRSTATIAGPVISGAARPLLAEHCDYGRDLASGGIELRVAREKVGYGRAEAEEYVSQTPRSTGSFYFKGDTEAAMRLVALFHASRGNVGTIWWPAAHAEWRLAADVTTAAVQLEAAPVAPHPDYLALRKTDGTLVARRISAIEGTTLTLDSAPGAFVHTSTTLLPLFLGRFNTTELKLDWTKPRAITADIPLLELPTETALPEGETAGTTIGDIGAPCWLYVVTDGDLTWRYTSFESAINAGALGTFEPRPIDHGDITSEINLQRHDTDLTVGWFAGSPFERARLDRLTPPLTVQIYEGTLASPAAAGLIFTGKAAGYQFQGGKCTCKIAGPTALFDVRGPVAVTSPRCWTPMYSYLCGLSREALSVAADLVGIDGDGTLRFVAAGAAGWPVVVRDHYRFGYAVRTLADGSRRTYSITGSSATGDGSVAPNPWSVGYRASAAGATLAPFDEHVMQGTLDIYRLNVPGYCLVERNNSTAPVNVGGLLPGGSINTHGYHPYMPVVRFTAPAAGVQTVAISTYNTASSIGHTVTVSIVRNGVVVFERFVSLGNELSFVADLSLAAGETIDVAIATGVDHSYDGTGLNFRVGAYSFAQDWLNPISTDAELKVTALRAPTSAELPESGWVLCPGCDGSWSRCGQLGNKANFRGCPHFPKTNPAMVSVKQETSSGSKK